MIDESQFRQLVAEERNHVQFHLECKAFFVIRPKMLSSNTPEPSALIHLANKVAAFRGRWEPTCQAFIIQKVSGETNHVSPPNPVEIATAKLRDHFGMSQTEIQQHVKVLLENGVKPGQIVSQTKMPKSSIYRFMKTFIPNGTSGASNA